MSQIEDGLTGSRRPARYVVFGEALTDFIREDGGFWRAVPGGSCWNVARVASRLGLPTGYAGAVSGDPLGDEQLRLTLEAGLDPRFTQRVDRSPFVAIVHSKDPLRYSLVGDDSADLHFDPDRLPPGWLEDAQAVHFGGASLVRPPYAERLLGLAERARAAGKWITWDPNFRAVFSGRYEATRERMARLADLVKVSDEDLAGLWPGRGEEQALRELAALAPRARILYTRGARGMRLLAPGRDLAQAALPVRVADTVGAGDASVGAFTASVLLRPGAPDEEHLRFCAAAAALVCSRHGAYAPSEPEVRALMEHTIR